MVTGGGERAALSAHKYHAIVALHLTGHVVARLLAETNLAWSKRERDRDRYHCGVHPPVRRKLGDDIVTTVHWQSCLHRRRQHLKSSYLGIAGYVNALSFTR